MKTEKAKIGKLEIFKERERGFNGDRRKFGTWAVFSYFTADGIEYRRGYWFPIGTSESGIFSKVPAEIEI